MTRNFYRQVGARLSWPAAERQARVLVVLIWLLAILIIVSGCAGSYTDPGPTDSEACRWFENNPGPWRTSPLAITSPSWVPWDEWIITYEIWWDTFCEKGPD